MLISKCIEHSLLWKSSVIMMAVALGVNIGSVINMGYSMAWLSLTVNRMGWLSVTINRMGWLSLTIDRMAWLLVTINRMGCL